LRRPAPRSLSSAIGRLAGELAPATALARVQEVWERATGPTIAAAARPVAERDGVVTVLCEASVWAHELELMGDDIVARLNGELGAPAVRELRCKTG
jgi:predicted nucleic acid-binding Zn ribbon protein